MNSSHLNLTMNQRLGNDYLLKNSMGNKLQTQQMGGISGLTQSSKAIPKND